MNYGQLKARVLDDAHRPDLTASVAGFISLAEGLIRRELRALPQTGTLTDANRSGPTSGIYTLPSGLLEIRMIHRQGDVGDALEQVALNVLRRRSTSATPVQYAVLGSTIDVRGIPGAGAVLDIEYLGHPAALVADPDTNDLLNTHEALYIFGALFHLYQFTQDVELAQGALDTFRDAIEKLNEAAGRKLGGASIAPAYNFGSGGSY